MEYPQLSSLALKTLKTKKLYQALEKCNSLLKLVFWFSASINILMLFMPIYTSQVLDRVLSSGSHETLIMLTIITLFAFASSAIIELCRSTTMSKMADWIDQEVTPEIISYSISITAIKGSSVTGEAVRDIGVIKNLITGNVMFLIFDAPWSILYLGAIFMIHPATGFIALGGAVVLFSLALWNELSTKKIIQESNESQIKNTQSIDTAARNSEVVEAMGMSERVVKKWAEDNAINRKLQMKAMKRSSIIMSITRFTRMSLQIAVMGVGAGLAIAGLKSTGGIIAASILMGKALSPFENAIGAWKSISVARASYKRLQILLLSSPKRQQSMELPKPKGFVSFERVFFTPYGTQKPTIKGISFEINPGEIVAIMGSSASGKSTIAKLLVGVWKAISGSVRLDGADVYTWKRESFGNYIGYLPQDVELFNATVKENIARMREKPDPQKVIEAARITGMHEMILGLPDGYDTMIGTGQNATIILSGGQKQLIGLTRAMYGNPKVLVLDEPNSSLDNLGELRLAAAIIHAKKNAITTFIITHKTNTLNLVDKIIFMQDGNIVEMGDRDKVVSNLREQSNKNEANKSQSNNEQKKTITEEKPNVNENNSTIEEKPDANKNNSTSDERPNINENNSTSDERPNINENNSTSDEKPDANEQKNI